MVISPSAAIARTPNKKHVAAINAKAANLVGGLTTLTISFLSARPGWPELRLRNKTVAIWHLDVWQTCLVELAVGGKDAVEAQDVGGDGIGLVDAQRTRRLIGHGAADVVEQCRRIGPEAANGLDRHVGGERALSANQAIISAALAVVAVADRAV